MLNPSSELKTCNVEELGQFRRLRRSCSTCDGLSDLIGAFSFRIIIFQRAPYNIFLVLWTNQLLRNFSSLGSGWPARPDILKIDFHTFPSSDFLDLSFNFLSLNWSSQNVIPPIFYQTSIEEDTRKVYFPSHTFCVKWKAETWNLHKSQVSDEIMMCFLLN